MKTLRLRKAYSVFLKEIVLWVAEPICLQDWRCPGCFSGTTALEAEASVAKKNVLNNGEGFGRSWKEMEGEGKDIVYATF